mmetsp:Transcript_5632/g.15832  ORF Transcript_5632/g.15832 Transcript_5632/m.15832 type:complete len:223 (+) Transcript_5632:704-1372(+)
MPRCVGELALPHCRGRSLCRHRLPLLSSALALVRAVALWAGSCRPCAPGGVLLCGSYCGVGRGAQLLRPLRQPDDGIAARLVVRWGSGRYLDPLLCAVLVRPLSRGHCDRQRPGDVRGAGSLANDLAPAPRPLGGRARRGAHIAVWIGVGGIDGQSRAARLADPGGRRGDPRPAAKHRIHRLAVGLRHLLDLRLGLGLRDLKRLGAVRLVPCGRHLCMPRQG